jgi:alkanesulfonate monooxygenase SsuD/methylene tetrahydromethanopterin reductase-like flavin-dependent oxidoreductase (luciferase family)
MAPSIGYLLPTRENIMEGRPAAAPLLALAERAAGLGYDSIWVGDSITSRPRHEPLTLLAAVAGRVPKVKIGTAVLLPALRNPVVLAHLLATLDQVSDGRLIVGIGIAQDLPRIRAEFANVGVPWDKRIGRMIEAMDLCRAFWAGKPVDWDGRWQIKGETVAPTPVQKGGPPIWCGGRVPASWSRAARHFDGWFPNGPDSPRWGEGWAEVKKAAAEFGRDPAKLTGAAYLTIAIDVPAAAQRRIDEYLTAYYGQPPETLRRVHTYYAGPEEGAAAWLKAYADAGCSHFVLRLAGDHENQLEAVARVRKHLGW